MRYSAWPLWRNNRWELEVFEEEGSTVIERPPLKELLNRPEVARVLDRLLAEANFPAQPSKWELLSEPAPGGEVVGIEAAGAANDRRPKMIDQRQIDPSVLEAAKDNGTLRRIIRVGAPLTREKWVSMNYLGHPPKPWTSEHEAEVPEPIRRQLYNDCDGWSGNQ